MTIRNFLLALGLHMAAASSAFALTISLDFNSLPSAQGWTIVNSTARVEGDMYSVNGSTLLQDTIGVGSGYAYYQIPDVIDPTLGYTIEVRARVLSEERGTHAALQFAAEATDWYSYVGIGRNTLNANDISGQKTIPYDNTVFHTYTYTVLPSGQYDLRVDGAPALSGYIARALLPNVLYFGDGTTGENGKIEMSLFRFSQPIPEPEAYAMLLAGLGLVGIAARRRERATSVA